MTEVLPDETSIVTTARTAVRTIACVYCHEPIAADTFTYMSSANRLLSAVCPTCERRVTLAAVTWRRLTRQHDSTSPATP